MKPAPPVTSAFTSVLRPRQPGAGARPVRPAATTTAVADHRQRRRPAPRRRSRASCPRIEPAHPGPGPDPGAGRSIDRAVAPRRPRRRPAPGLDAPSRRPGPADRTRRAGGRRRRRLRRSRRERSGWPAGTCRRASRRRASRRPTPWRRAAPSRDQGGEGLPLDRDPPAGRDAVEHDGLEHVGPGVDQVGRRLAGGRLLDERDDPAVVVGGDDAERGGVVDRREGDGRLGPASPVEGDQRRRRRGR